MKCKKCNSQSILRNGKNRLGIQRYLCRNCRCSFQESYIYQSSITTDKEIILLTKESCGIRSIGRILHLSPSTVIRRIKKIASSLTRPYLILKGKAYEVDELFTYVKAKDNKVCVAYSYEPKTGYVFDISIGRRNKTNLRKIISTLILSDAQQINTDKLRIYKELIPEEIHSTKNRGINHIERQNLTLRTHLKRLHRRTLCYSKSLMMLLAVVKIFFLGIIMGDF